MSNNTTNSIMLVGDIKAVVSQVMNGIRRKRGGYFGPLSKKKNGWEDSLQKHTRYIVSPAYGNGLGTFDMILNI